MCEYTDFIYRRYVRLAGAWSYIINLSYDFVCWYFFSLYCSFFSLPPHAFLPFLYIFSSRRSSVYIFSLSFLTLVIFFLRELREKIRGKQTTWMCCCWLTLKSLHEEKRRNLIYFLSLFTINRVMKLQILRHLRNTWYRCKYSTPR